MSVAQTEVITALSHAMRNVRFGGEPDQTYDTRFHAAGDHLHITSIATWQEQRRRTFALQKRHRF